MSSIDQLHISLPPDMAAKVQHAVEAGEYESSAKVVEAALREWTTNRELRESGIIELQRLWQEASGEESPGLDPDAVFDELEQKYRSLAEAALAS